MNQIYNVEIKTLTPLHIGDGSDLSGLQYFCYQEKVANADGDKPTFVSWMYTFDINDLMSILDQKDRAMLLQEIEDGKIQEIGKIIYSLLKDTDDKNREIVSKYKDKFLNISNLQKLKVSNTFYRYRKEKIQGRGGQFKGKTEYKREQEKKTQQSQMNVQRFINSMGRYYIPGSSLKGAIRTVLLGEELGEKISKNIDKDPFKKLIVQDSEFFVNESLMVDALARKGGGGAKKQGDGQFAQFVSQGSKTNSKIVFKSFLDESDLLMVDFSIKNICDSANEYLSKKITKYIKEINELKKHPDLQKRDQQSEKKLQKLQSVTESFERVLVELKSCGENECVLALGFGTGYWFKMYGDKEEKHPSPHRIKHLIDPNINIPRTNRTTQLENLGFVKLTFSS